MFNLRSRTLGDIYYLLLIIYYLLLIIYYLLLVGCKLV